MTSARRSEEWLADYRRKQTPPKQIETPDAKPTEPESELQARCEAWLLWRGYGRRAPKKMQTHKGGRWQIHLNATERNPIMPDLLLIDNGRCIEIELKVKGGRLSPDQQAMAFRGEWLVAWSLHEFQVLVEEWEADAEMARDG